MQAEWSKTVDGKLGLEAFLKTLYAAAAPLGITNLEWEIRRATCVIDEITYKFDLYDDRDEAAGAYAREVRSAYVVIGVYPPDSRDMTATVYLTYDAGRTRVRVESPAVKLLERLRAAMRGTGPSAEGSAKPGAKPGTPGGEAVA